MSEHRKNLQVKQPNVLETPSEKEYGEPLSDPSSPLRIAVTNGSNGEQRNFDAVKTSAQ